MRVLITGGSGFIGSHLADRLLARGDHVLVIDNYATGRRDNLLKSPNLKIIEGTIADEALIARSYDEFRPQKVIHAAASYKDPANWQEDVRTNILGTAIIVHACQRHHVERLIYFQTALCYGLKPVEQPITLNHPICPEGSSYALSKTSAEQYIQLSGLDYISFRLANAYGPRNISGPLPTFYQRLTNNIPCFVTDTRRDFIYVEDLIDCTLLALDGAGRKGAYHISSGRDYAIKTLFDETVASLGIKLEKPVEVRERSADDTFTILIDPSQTNLDFGWKVTTSLKNGIHKAIEYYQTYGIAETYTHLKNR
jgi:UDP-glucose 4-epimerase